MADYSELREQEEYFGGATAVPAIPRDNFADMILEAALCHSQLVGKITQMEFDVAQGQGGVVQVPMIAARVGQGPFTTDCRCLTAASSTITTATVTIASWGDYELMCEFPLWKATPYVKGAIINEMAKGLANRMDYFIWQQIWTIANAASHHWHTTVSCNSTATTGVCCVYRFDLWDRIIQGTASMQATGRNPDTIIMSPTVAAWFHKNPGFMDSHPNLLQMDNMGHITYINGLKYIPFCAARACAVSTGAPSVLVAIIDSKRAIAEAWGKRPTWEEVRDPHCDDYQEVVWAYWGATSVDAGAIWGILNP